MEFHFYCYTILWSQLYTKFHLLLINIFVESTITFHLLLINIFVESTVDKVPYFIVIIFLWSPIYIQFHISLLKYFCGVQFI